MLLSTPIYVLKSQNRGDSDRVYTAFSKKYGKIEFVAKGARKTLAKLSGYLERPAKASVSLTEGQGLKLISALSQSQYLGLKSNLTSLGLCLKGLDLADKLILAPEPDIELWKIIGGFLEAEEVLAKHNAPLWQKYLAYYYFIIKLIAILGYAFGEDSSFENKSSAGKWLIALSRAKNFKEASVFFDNTDFPQYFEKEFKAWNAIFRKIISRIPSLE